MNNTDNSEIKKSKISKLFILILICIIIIVLFIFFIKKPSPKSTVLSFINAMENANYDKILNYIDFDSMVAFSTTNGNINEFDSALNHLNEMSDSEREIHIESISHEKRYIQATLDSIARDNVIFNIVDIQVSDVENNDKLNKVAVKFSVQQHGNTVDENMIFYTMKKGKTYYIVDFDGELYF